ncbi:FAD synthetase family protein [Listeria aquatica]|uniref:FAD synthase n=1 Tax=Listeria aquatica TaxID=1494960 RepID=A0A841ZQJ7_9LIST|nr:FAD synthetase family protein [Listeria aquatica]MBC1521250.1 FAD synthetase family protein [Listeria aquatica]
MEIYHVDLAPVPDSRQAVLSIGKFDGVHRGHQRILQMALEIKKPDELYSVISFSPHPLWALKGLPEFREALTPGAEKERWLAYYGVDVLYETNFTKEYAETTPEQFVYEHLSQLNLSHIIVGEEFNFGKGAVSDVELLRGLVSPLGIQVTAIPVETEEGILDKISSTEIRALIRDGNFAKAEKLLGHPFYVTGEVRDGVMHGIEDYCLPAPGRYETESGIVFVTEEHKITSGLPDGRGSIRFVKEI